MRFYYTLIFQKLQFPSMTFVPSSPLTINPHIIAQRATHYTFPTSFRLSSIPSHNSFVAYNAYFISDSPSASRCSNQGV